uniref:Uncharacterized protein n=1 Tax=Meloidogyne enterolobii TaxID=390850 RepID=A0A6V7X488_MELEN|nr:unnamed protein product [Meloidogyne enterolobii]
MPESFFEYLKDHLKIYPDLDRSIPEIEEAEKCEYIKMEGEYKCFYEIELIEDNYEINLKNKSGEMINLGNLEENCDEEGNCEKTFKNVKN